MLSKTPYIIVLQRIFFYLWLVLFSCTLIMFIIQPDIFSRNNLIWLIQRFNTHILFIYILICAVRGLLLLPSTPFVLAGVFLFPSQEILIMIISLSCILLSAAFIFYFSKFIALDEFFKRKYPDKIQYLSRKINHPYGVLFVVLWAFFPLVPTDLMCYVAGTIKMDFRKFILAIFIGEFPLVLSCVFFGKTFLPAIF